MHLRKMNSKSSHMQKKILTISLAALLGATAATAQSLDDAYRQFDTAASLDGWRKGAAMLTLYSAQHSDEWPARYYVAYADAFLSLKEADPVRRDQLLDAAVQQLDGIDALHPPADEVTVLQAYIDYARFAIDPQGRWQKYLTDMNAQLEKTKQLNPANPRLYYLEGIPIFIKPKFYGGGKEKARPYFEKARSLFAQEDSTSILKPHWGARDNADYLSKCQ